MVKSKGKYKLFNTEAKAYIPWISLLFLYSSVFTITFPFHPFLNFHNPYKPPLNTLVVKTAAKLW